MSFASPTTPISCQGLKAFPIVLTAEAFFINCVWHCASWWSYRREEGTHVACPSGLYSLEWKTHFKQVSLCEKCRRRGYFWSFWLWFIFQELGLKVCEYSRERPSSWVIEMQSIGRTFGVYVSLFLWFWNIKVKNKTAKLHVKCDNLATYSKIKLEWPFTLIFVGYCVTRVKLQVWGPAQHLMESECLGCGLEGLLCACDLIKLLNQCLLTSTPLTVTQRLREVLTRSYSVPSFFTGNSCVSPLWSLLGALDPSLPPGSQSHNR